MPSFDKLRSRAEPVISFRNISKSFCFGRALTPAVDDVSLDIARGSFVSLLGPSGCGKTTLLNLIAGLVTTDTGKVFHEGKEIRAPNAGIGYMTQLDALLPWRSVISNVALPLEIRHVRKAERLMLPEP